MKPSGHVIHVYKLYGIVYIRYSLYRIDYNLRINLILSNITNHESRRNSLGKKLFEIQWSSEKIQFDKKY